MCVCVCVCVCVTNTYARTINTQIPSSPRGQKPQRNQKDINTKIVRM